VLSISKLQSSRRKGKAMLKKLREAIRGLIKSHQHQKEYKFYPTDITLHLEVNEYEGTDRKPRYTLLGIFPIGNKYKRIVLNNADIGDIKSELQEIFEMSAKEGEA